MSETGKILAAYGSGGFGREVLELGKLINERKGPRWNDFVFIDDSDEVPSKVDGYSVYGYTEAMKKYGKYLDVVIAVGEPGTRSKLMKKLQADRIDMPVLINPDSFVSSNAVIGRGSVIRYGCSVFCGAIIGENVCLNPHANIGHDSIIGEGCMIGTFSNIAGGVNIGAYAFIGMSAVIREQIKVGESSVVSMGAIIRKDVPAYTLAIGDPTKLMRIDDGFRVFKNARVPAKEQKWT